MSRLLRVVAVLLALAAPALAAPPAGNWKLRLPLPTQRGPVEVTFLMAFSEVEKTWVGDLIATNPRLPFEPKIVGLSVAGDAVKFGLEFNKGEKAFEFEGAFSKDGKKLAGSYTLLGDPLKVIELPASKLKKLTDAIDVAREDFAQLESGQQLFETGFAILAKAAEKKLTADEARGVVEKMTKAAATYGERWERTVTLKLVDTLATQEGLAEVAVAQARRAERMLTDDAPIAQQMAVLEAVSRALTRAGKPAEAKKYDADLAKLETQDLIAFVKETITFETPSYTGRKAKSDRVAIVEVFTGAECPPCLAVDAAFDGLLKTYKPTDVLLLQYHIHVPGPDPLSNEDTLGRAAGLFGERISAPRVIINGKETVRGGGPLSAAKAKYADLRTALEKDLEEPAKAKLALSVAKGEKGLTVKAAVSDLDKPGEKVMLRFAVVEPMVRYVGGNGARYHQNVVRAMPGGANGFVLTKKAEEKSITINIEELRIGLNKYLDEFAKEAAPFPNPDRPLRLKNLKVIAFIQDDASGEILTGTSVDLDGK